MIAVQQVNLFQPSFRKQKETITSRTILTATVAVISGVALLSVYLVWKVSVLEDRLQIQTQAHQEKIKQLEQTSQKFRPKRKSRLLQAELEQLQQQKLAKHRILNTISDQVFGNITGFAAHLEGLARRNVEGLWLTSVNITDGGKHIGLTGSSLEPEKVPEFLQQLSNEQAFRGTEFSTFKMERKKKELKVVDFIISTTVGKDSI